jgi:DNA-binding response OmpR family regulator
MPYKHVKGLALMIEDEADIRRFVSIVLALEGLNVVEADTSELGLELACQNKCVPVLLDLRLPGRDGWAVLKEMKEDANLHSIPVIVVTASAGVEQQEKALNMSATDYLVKPLSAPSLKKAVAQILRRERWH